MTVKFFCRDGECVLSATHLPVSVGRDEQYVSDFAEAGNGDAATGIRDRARMWNFVAQNPQALNLICCLYSDRGTIAGYQSMDSYIPPMLWTNKKGEQFYVRCVWIAKQRRAPLTRLESEELSGSDPDALARDLVNSISRGENVQYEFNAQIITPQDTGNLEFDPADPTFAWPTDRFPLMPIGLLTLNRLTENFENQVKNAEMSPYALVEGISFALPVRPPADGLEIAGESLRAMTEEEAHVLAGNLAEEISHLSPDLMEKILVMFTKADLAFGRVLTSILGG